MTGMPGEWVVNYLRSSRGRYTRETLTTVLLAAGHSQAEIDDAIAYLEAEGTAPLTNTLRRRPRAALHGIAIGVGYVAALFALAVLASAAGTGVERFVVLLAGSLGIVGWWQIRRLDQVVAGGFIAGIVLALLIPLVFYLGFLVLVLVAAVT